MPWRRRRSLPYSHDADRADFAAPQLGNVTGDDSGLPTERLQCRNQRGVRRKRHAAAAKIGH